LPTAGADYLNQRRTKVAVEIREAMQIVAVEINGQKSFPNPTGLSPDSKARAERARIELGLPEGTPIEVIREKHIQRESEQHAQRWAKEAEDRKRETTNRRWLESGVPVRHRAKVNEFSDPPEWIGKKASAWTIVVMGGIVALIGTRGTGKTQLAVDLLFKACEHDSLAKYLKAMDFFTELRATFKKNSEADEAGIIEKYTLPRLLVIDNVDRRGSSEWEDRLLTHLIDKRYDRCAATILIANLDEAAFAAHVGVDVVDRIRDGGGLIVADWPGFRGT
jgi:DNA replication protein DnaC